MLEVYLRPLSKYTACIKANLTIWRCNSSYGIHGLDTAVYVDVSTINVTHTCKLFYTSSEVHVHRDRRRVWSSPFIPNFSIKKTSRDKTTDTDLGNIVCRLCISFYCDRVMHETTELYGSD